jgi:hypothetical protein
MPPAVRQAKAHLWTSYLTPRIASARYAHNKDESGIMRMFGGFSAGFFHEYHRLVPNTHPTAEYEDRNKLYQLSVPFTVTCLSKTEWSADNHP